MMFLETCPKMYSFIVFVIFLITNHVSSTPSFFKICSRDDFEFNDCLKDSINSVIPMLANGFNESNICFPSLDPLFEREIIFQYNLNQVNLVCVLQNVKLYGLAKSKVRRVRSNLPEDSVDLELDTSNEKLLIKGAFTVDGNINAARISTQGNFKIIMSDLTWTWKLICNPKVRDGKTHMVVNSFFMRPEVGFVDMKFPPLVPSDPIMSDYIARSMKENWKLIYGEMLPIVEKIFSKIGKRLSNKIFKRIPYDELFPPEF